MFALMDTSAVPANLRLYLPILLEALFESPIERDGKLIPYEEIVTELNNDTVTSSGQLGLIRNGRFTCGPYAQTAVVQLQVDTAKYERGISWLKEILYKTVFTTERLKIIATKMANDIAQAKRNGKKVLSNIKVGLFYKQGDKFCLTNIYSI